MSAPGIWIILPILFAFGMLVVPSHNRWAHLASLAFSAILVTLSITLPLGEIVVFPYPFNQSTILVRESLSLAGVKLVITNIDKPLISLIYIVLTAWFAGGYVNNIHQRFLSLSIGIAALLITAFSIEPRLLATFIIVIAAFCSAPFLFRPETSQQRGVLRFLTFQLLGFFVILLGNWVFSISKIQPELLIDQKFPFTLLLIGAALTLPMFPFQSWISLVSEEAEPQISSFIFTLFPLINILAFFEIFSRLGMATNLNNLGDIVRIQGTIMVMVGGMGVVFEPKLNRLAGFVVIHQIGVLLLTLSLMISSSIPDASLVFAGQLAVFGVTLFGIFIAKRINEYVQIPTRSNAELESKGEISAETIGQIIGIFSAAGVPLLAGFPIYLILFSNLAQISAISSILLMVSNFLLSLGGFRLLSKLFVMRENPSIKFIANNAQFILLITWLVVVLAFGVFPQFFWGYFAVIPASVLPSLP